MKIPKTLRAWRRNRQAMRLTRIGLFAYLCVVSVSLTAATVLISGGIPTPVLVATAW